MFVAMLFSLWLRGGFSRWKAEAKATEKAVRGMLRGDGLGLVS